MDPARTLIDLLIGLLAGSVGGLAGIGGSIIMLPALAIFHGYQTERKSEHHVYMAASMLVNIVVSLMATRTHARKGIARRDLLAWLAPSMCVGIVAGAMTSTRSPGHAAVIALAVFIWLYCLYTLVTLARRLPDHPDDARTPHWRVLVPIGLGTGLVAGFMGIGGGIVLVPLLQIAGLSVRHAIAGSAAVMWISAAVGALTKIVELPKVGFSPWDAVQIAAPMGAGAILGAWFGAWLSHKLRVPALRAVIMVILALAAARMVAA
ncbi:MAG: sulfite exporter TauE/SafE family protein [Phycisphaerales bacterium]|nr:sulfite exporter TauE/SafE family protein [Planctomycetota bacterium]MCH8507254.1 sulfite exporter TauE/SafE family protein [Phycisphaerales bacterium]